MYLAAEFLQRVGVTGILLEARAQLREELELLARAGEVLGPERRRNLIVHRTGHAFKMGNGPGAAP